MKTGARRPGSPAAIFRPYWVDSACVQVAAIGDISLDSAWRGRGLGRRLRSAETVLQVHSRDGSAERLAGRMTQGDKYT